MRIERKVGAGVVMAGSLLLAMSSGVPASASNNPSAMRVALSAVQFARAAKNATSPGEAG